MKWDLICLAGLLLSAIASVISILIFARRGDSDSLKDMSFVKRMMAQFTVIGRVRDAVRNPLHRETEQYHELAKMVDDLQVKKIEKE